MFFNGVLLIVCKKFIGMEFVLRVFKFFVILMMFCFVFFILIMVFEYGDSFDFFVILIVLILLLYVCEVVMFEWFFCDVFKL